MNKGYVSIVIPIYNGQDYLLRTFDCLEKQTYDKLEIILVDDYSTDNSAFLCMEECKRDNRFRYVQPPTKMRYGDRSEEYGFTLCTGEYYFYLSQDDFMDYELIEKCVEKSEKTGAEVVVPNGWYYYDENNKSRIGHYPIDGDYSKLFDHIECFKASLDWQIHGFVLKKMGLTKKIGKKAEFFNSDEYYTRIGFLEANEIAFADTNFYYVMNNPNAETRRFNYRMVDVMWTDIMLLHKCFEVGLEKEYIQYRLRKYKREYFTWYKVMVANRVVFTDKMYVPRMLCRIFLELFKVRITLLLKK